MISDPETAGKLKLTELEHGGHRGRMLDLLPMEVLSHIFVQFKWSTSDRLRSWTVISEVCTHWRDVASNTPTLWSTIELHHVRRSILMLERSREAPLDVSCSLPHASSVDDSAAFWTLATSVMSVKYQERIHRLSVWTDDLTSLRRFFDLVVTQMKAPEFRFLSVGYHSITSDDSENVAIPFWKDIVIPLQHFQVDGIPLPSLLSSFPHLTELSYTDATHAFYSDVSGLVNALKHMPTLQRLRARLVSLASRSPLPIKSPIKLPHLQHIDISASSPLSSRLFRSIDFPHTASINIKYDTGRSMIEFVPIFQLFATIVRTSGIIPSETLHLDVDFFNVHIELRSHVVERTLALRIPRLPSTFREPVGLDLRYFNCLPLDAVTNVEVEYGFVDTRITPWCSILRELSNTTSFSIDSFRANILQSILQESVPPFPIMPKLEFLSCELNWGEIEVVKNLVRERRRSGVPLKMVVFQGMDVDAEDAEILKLELAKVEGVAVGVTWG